MSMTVGQMQKQIAAGFKDAGIASAALDARVLVAAACRLSDEDMIAQSNCAIGQMEAFRLERFAARRLAGEPVSRIIGRREFWGMEFLVTPATLDPRPDTETLVEAALAWARNYSPPLTPPQAGEEAKRGGSLRILDLGTGTGCILIALLKELPHATGVGVDISSGALVAAGENARRHGVESRVDFRHGSWFEPLESAERFDLIVSNPPYIAESEMESLAMEVRNHDPRSALTDEKDGLEAYRAIYPQLDAWLKPGGMAFFEMGYAQGSAMTRLVADSYATLDRIIKDLAGHERVVALSLPNQNGDNKKKLNLPR